MTNNFSLNGANDWGAIEFWSPDSSQGYEVMCNIYLGIDYLNRTAQIVACELRDDLPSEEGYQVVSWSLVPEDTDFSLFGKFYAKEILPMLQSLPADTNPDTYDLAEEIEYLCEHAPKHTLKYAIDVRSAYDDDLDMLAQALTDDGIDILTADLENEGILTRIINVIEMGDVILIDTQLGEMRLSRAEYRSQLQEIQAELREVAASLEV